MKIIILLAIIPLFTSAFVGNYFEIFAEPPTTEPKFKVKSVIESKIPGTYIYTIEACTGQTLRAGDVYVSSDKEIVGLVPEGVEDRIIEEGTCGVWEIHIQADNPEEIRVMVPSPIAENTMVQAEVLVEQLKSPLKQMAEGKSANEVICKDDLVLLIKSSDGSAACVTPSTAEKLVERGWGQHF